MSIEDRARWDDRYRQSSELPDPRPPVALESSGVELPSAGRALDVACGAGSVSVWMAMQGLDVFGLDVSPVAVASAAELAALDDIASSTRFAVVDLDEGVPDGHFDVVVCQRFRDPGRYADLAAAVAPGGLLVITVLSTVGHEGAPGPFRAAPGELVAAFGHVLDVVWSAEADGESHLVARRPVGPTA